MSEPSLSIESIFGNDVIALGLRDIVGLTLCPRIDEEYSGELFSQNLC